MAETRTFVRLPADGTGKMLKARQLSEAGQTVLEQAMFLGALDTYFAWTGGIAPANAKHMLSIWNANSSAQILRLRGLWVVNLSLTAVTGVGMRWDLKWITAAPTGGTTVTPNKADSTSPALANVTCMHGATGGATAGDTLWSVGIHNDEIPLTGIQPEDPFLHLIPKQILDLMPITINPNEGVDVVCATSTTVGTLGLLAAFSVQATA